jgi:hypothetical protein
MRLRVLTLTKHSIFLNVDPSTSIDELKARLTQDTGIPLNGQRLVFKGQELLAGNIDENGINEDDFIVVVVIQQPSIKKSEIKMSSVKSISRREDVAADEDQTSDLSHQFHESRQPVRHLDVEGNEEDVGVDDEDDHDLEDVDPDALQQLMDMGFQANRANKALIITRGNTQMAMDWLLEHERDPDIDEPLTLEQIDRLRAGDEEDEYGDNGGEGMMIDPHEAAQRLMELGFAQEDIAYALEATGHDFEAAAAWLLGDYFPPPPPPPQGLGHQEPPYLTDDPDEDVDDDQGGDLSNAAMHRNVGPR